MEEMLVQMAITTILTKIKDKVFMVKVKPALLKLQKVLNETFPVE